MQRGDSLFIRVSYVSGGKQLFSGKKRTTRQWKGEVELYNHSLLG